MNKRQLGQACEKAVCDFLVKRDYKLVCSNYYTPYGEIDIIALKDEIICFVEVKARKENSLVSGVEAVNFRKKGRIISSAEMFLAENSPKYDEFQPRYDIADVTFNVDNGLLIKRISFYANAFDTTDIYTGF